MVIYQCEDSMESIFTAVYRAYEERKKPEDTMICLTDESFLFAEYVSVEADGERAKKVARTLWREFGEEDYYRICMALTASDTEKGQAVYRTIAAGLRDKCRRGHLFDNLKDNHVRKAFTLARGAGREYDHQRGFLRFQEMELVSESRQRVLYARIGPKYHIITFLMEHFADRFPEENFMIYDDHRRIMGIHPTEQLRRVGKLGSADLLADDRSWYLVQCEDDFAETDKLKESDRELVYQELFTYFCHKIAIKERRNLELQKNMLPLRFREYMTEFKARTEQFQ